MISSTAVTGTSLGRAALIRELQKTRQQSVIATRHGDFRKVAQLSLAIARLNNSLQHAELEQKAGDRAPRS
jgi:hypothetical protein